MTRAERGVFAVFEGIDGAGKTVQIRRLAAALTAAGHDPVVSREPTAGPWGQKLRASALAGRLSAEEELDAFIHDRTEHVEHLIAPSLAAGRIVLLDRYFYSTVAYQGIRGLDTRAVRAEMERRFPIPDAVFLIDIDPVLALERIARSRGAAPDEFEKLESLRRTREVFLTLGEPVVTIDGARDEASVHRDVVSGMARVLAREPAWNEVRAALLRGAGLD